MTDAGEMVTAIVSGALLAAGAWRWGERAVSALEQWSRAKHRHEERIGELKKSERECRGNLIKLSEQLFQVLRKAEALVRTETQLRGALQRQTGRLVAAQEENTDLRRDLSAAGGKFRTTHSGVEPEHAREETGPHRIPRKRDE